MDLSTVSSANRDQTSTWPFATAQAMNSHMSLGGNTKPSLSPVTAVESLVWPLSTTHVPLCSSSFPLPHFIFICHGSIGNCSVSHSIIFLPKQFYMQIFTGLVQGLLSLTHHKYWTHLGYPAAAQSQGNLAVRQGTRE